MTQHSYIRGEDGVAGGRFLHRHRQAEGPSAQTAMLHQRNPLWRREHDLIVYIYTPDTQYTKIPRAFQNT